VSEFKRVGLCSYCDATGAATAEMGPDESGRERFMCSVCYEIGVTPDVAMMSRPVRLDQLSRAVRLVLTELRRKR
jgi:hypothetical protein